MRVAAMQAQAARHKFTSEEYHLMAKAGIFRQDARLELIEGDIIEMAPIGSRHAACVKRTSSLMQPGRTASFVLGVQDPVQLSDGCEPQPDISILRYSILGYGSDHYADAHPRPEDILLIIEVCDTKLEYDREYDREHKVPMYARWQAPEVWLAGLPGGRVEVYRDPGPDGYRRKFTATGDDSLSPELLPQLRLTPREILGL